MRKLLLIGALLLAGAVSAPAARAATFAPRLPEVVIPGQEIELRWSGLPSSVEEVEIVLSLDGGRTFPVRVSRELDARDQVHRWRVPRFESGTAMLRLRMGSRHHEVDGPTSALFRISGPTGLPLHRVMDVGAYFENASWSRFEALAGAVPHGFMPPETRIEARDLVPMHAPPEPLALGVPAVGSSVTAIPFRRASRGAVRELPSQAPRLDPLRI
jgi:hypothetical protein